MALTEMALRAVEAKASNPEMSNSDAYLQGGYSNCNGNMKTVNEKASRLFAKPEVKEYLDKLLGKVRARAEARVQFTFEDSLKELVDALIEIKEDEILNARKSEKVKALVSIVKEINSMNGYNAKNISMDANVTTYEDRLKEVTGDEF